MNKNNLYTLITIVAVVFATYYQSRKHVASQNEPIKAPIPKHTQSRKSEGLHQLALNKALVGKAPAEMLNPLIDSKINFNLRTFARLSPDFAKLNPGFEKLHPNDPKVANLILPRGTRLTVLIDQNCSKIVNKGLGQDTETKVTEMNANKRLPTYIAFKTEREQTIGQLSRDIANDSCVRTLVPSGTINSALIKDLKISDYVDPEKVGSPELIQNDQVMALGEKMVSARLSDGNFDVMTVYTLGAQNEALIVPSNADPTEPYLLPYMYPQQNAARFFTIPQIPNSDSADEITNLNNSIVMAADSGATVIVVPNLDPNLVSTATAYAEERGIPVYMVPREPFYGRRSPSSAD